MANISFAPFCNFLIEFSASESTVSEATYDPFEGKDVLFERLSNRDMKDKLIADERMKQFERDVLHWINYDYVVINDNLEELSLIHI